MPTIPASRQVLTVDGAGRIAVREQPMPAIRPGTVLVEVRSSLISAGTEIGSVRRRRSNPDPAAPPTAFGYGNAGVVLAAAPDCAGLEPGAPLACIGAGYALHASHAVVPVNLTCPIPEGQSFDEAAFAHLAATALHAVRRAQIQFGHAVAVFGLGVVGQLVAQIARASGARVVAIDRLPLRVRVAADCHADLALNAAEEDPVPRTAELTAGRGLDAAFLAFDGDATATLKQAVQMLKTAPDGHKMGAVVIVGGATLRDAQFPTPFGNIDIRPSSRPGPGYHDEAWEHGRDYPPVFVEWTTRRNMEECLRAAADHRIAPAALITHRMPLERGPEACDLLINHPDQAIGVILRP